MTFKPAKFLDPKSDIVFKKIFGQNADLVKSFLNGVMPFKEGALIETLTYLPTEQIPRIPSLKNTIVDVKCTDQSGRIFIIEMQMTWSASFTKRLLFGVSKAYVQQLDSGENYVALCPVYGLGIVNAIFDRSTEEWFHHYRTVNIKNTSKVLEGLELVFLELPKFKPQTLEHRKMGVLWLRFLREINEKMVDVPQEFTDNPELSRAMELAQESSYTPAELEAYDKYWDAVRVEKTLTQDAFQEGKNEGIELGKAEGIELGEAKGRAEKSAMVKGMLKAGVSIDVIAEVSGMSREQIEKL
mgnify:FL=1